MIECDIFLRNTQLDECNLQKNNKMINLFLFNIPPSCPLTLILSWGGDGVEGTARQVFAQSLFCLHTGPSDAHLFGPVPRRGGG